jgi:hypothetical protein
MLIFKTYNSWYETKLTYSRRTQKNHEAKFSIIQNIKSKQISIKKIRIKSNIKTKWNKTTRNETENKIKKKIKKIAIKIIRCLYSLVHA